MHIHSCGKIPIVTTREEFRICVRRLGQAECRASTLEESIASVVFDVAMLAAAPSVSPYLYVEPEGFSTSLSSGNRTPSRLHDLSATFFATSLPLASSASPALDFGLSHTLAHAPRKCQCSEHRRRPADVNSPPRRPRSRFRS